MTDIEEYKPTRQRRQLLNVLINPDYRYKSVLEICKLARISRQTYYKAFEDERFVKLYKKVALELVDSSIAPVLNAFIKAAKAGSFQHGKILLEMSGLHTDKNSVDLSSPDGTMSPSRGLDDFYASKTDT